MWLALVLLGIALLSGPSEALGADTGHLYGNAFYADHSPAGGIEVGVQPSGPGVHQSRETVLTDDAGNWDAGAVPAGSYSVIFTSNVSNGTLASRSRYSAGSQAITVSPGAEINLSTTLTGPKPDAAIVGPLIMAEGWPASDLYSVRAKPVDGAEIGEFDTNAAGEFRAFVPTGTYEVSTISGGGAATTVSASAGHVTHTTLQIAPFSVGAPIEPRRTEQELAWLNAQRAEWGLPADIVNVPLWSQYCAAHDRYLSLNKQLGHSEAGGEGASEGGRWGGEHSILAEGSSEEWSRYSNPWNDAPSHLAQLFAPRISVTGIDDSHGYQCVTTLGGYRRPSQPPGTIYTYPGDGTTGFPPAELAQELPRVPGENVGITGLAGRELFVYEEDAEFGSLHPEKILSASLRSKRGPAEVRWVQSSAAGGPGGIIIPVDPLRPHTLYHAKVTLAGFRGSQTTVPQITHTWTFSTGATNARGEWPPLDYAARPSIRLRRRGRRIVVRGGGFVPGPVTLTRRPKRRRFTVTASPKGRLHLSFRWKMTRRVKVVAVQTTQRTVAALGPRRGRR